MERGFQHGRSAMSIRWKFLLILLGFSLTPLLVFVVLNYRVSLGLGEDLGDISRRLIIYTANKELQDNVENYARNLSREMRLVEDVLRAYASAVENEGAGLSQAGGAQTRAHKKSEPDLPERMTALQGHLAPIRDYVEQQRILPAGGAAAYPEAAAEAERRWVGPPPDAGYPQGGGAQPVWVVPKIEGHATDPAVLSVSMPLRRS